MQHVRGAAVTHTRSAQGGRNDGGRVLGPWRGRVGEVGIGERWLAREEISFMGREKERRRRTFGAPEVALW